MATTADVARIARKVCKAFADGATGLTIGHTHFEMADVGYCSEFARECCEAALQALPHTLPYFGADARKTEARLIAADTKVATPQPGDIVCFNTVSGGTYGHIGIHLDRDYFAENTSSKARGPGFVTSTYEEMGLSRVTGYYHLPELEKEEPYVDVDKWADADVVWAKQARIMSGDPDGKFRGRDPVTRQELAAVAHRIVLLVKGE